MAWGRDEEGGTSTAPGLCLASPGTKVIGCFVRFILWQVGGWRSVSAFSAGEKGGPAWDTEVL